MAQNTLRGGELVAIKAGRFAQDFAAAVDEAVDADALGQIGIAITAEHLEHLNITLNLPYPSRDRGKSGHRVDYTRRGLLFRNVLHLRNGQVKIRDRRWGCVVPWAAVQRGCAGVPEMCSNFFPEPPMNKVKSSRNGGRSATPLTGQQAHEIQAFGQVVAMPIALAEHVRSASVDNLNQLLADTMTLRDLYKKHHWQVSGHTFYQLHLLFDKHFGEQAELVDTIAERIMTLGGVSIAMAHDVAETTLIPRPPKGCEKCRSRFHACCMHTRLC